MDFSHLDNEILEFIDKTHALQPSEFERKSPVESTTSDELYSLSHAEENMMLKHFFRKLLPLLDAHPNSPWPDLALKYCDFDIARSCFISLACIHIYESREGGNEYYKRGVEHMNSAMDHLINNIQHSDKSLEEKDTTQQVATPNSVTDVDTKRLVSSFVTLVLINVHILFVVLDKGRSSSTRFFLKVFASICQDETFYESLLENPQKKSLMVVLSWYDTVVSIVSPDCRLPFCYPEWYGTKNDDISTLKMMGCPGEIFKAMSKVCFLRHEIAKSESNGSSDRTHDFSDLYSEEFDIIKHELVSYRDYIPLKMEGVDYPTCLKGAQCWSIAVLISLYKTVKPKGHEEAIQSLVREFLDIYGTMNSESPTVTQMVWPVYAVGCECHTEFERQTWTIYMDRLYATAQMGTLHTLKQIVEAAWKQNVSQEIVLREWLKPGDEYLPV